MIRATFQYCVRVTETPKKPIQAVIGVVFYFGCLIWLLAHNSSQIKLQSPFKTVIQTTSCHIFSIVDYIRVGYVDARGRKWVGIDELSRALPRLEPMVMNMSQVIFEQGKNISVFVFNSQTQLYEKIEGIVDYFDNRKLISPLPRKIDVAPEILVESLIFKRLTQTTELILKELSHKPGRFQNTFLTAFQNGKDVTKSIQNISREISASRTLLEFFRSDFERFSSSLLRNLDLMHGLLLGAYYALWVFFAGAMVVVVAGLIAICGVMRTSETFYRYTLHLSWITLLLMTILGVCLNIFLATSSVFLTDFSSVIDSAAKSEEDLNLYKVLMHGKMVDLFKTCIPLTSKRNFHHVLDLQNTMGRLQNLYVSTNKLNDFFNEKKSEMFSKPTKDLLRQSELAKDFFIAAAEPSLDPKQNADLLIYELTKLTDYKTRDSRQTGKCKYTTDEWVLNKELCTKKSEYKALDRR
jgi:hypothetical protein